MNLYLLTKEENSGYDICDSMVIAAENEEEAKHLNFIYYLSSCPFGDWSVTSAIKLIATNALVEEGVVCASFNAG